MAAKTSAAKLIAEIRAATGAEEEEVKAMLQLHEGDANAAILALVETPFQKVSGKHTKPAQHDGGFREQRGGPASGRRDGNYAGGGGRGRGPRPDYAGGRGGRGSGYASSSPAPGRGRGGYAPRDTPSSAPALKADNGHAEVQPDPTPAGSGWDAPSSSAPAVAAGSAWGAPAGASAAAAAPPAGAWGAGNKTMAERIKAKQVAPPPAPVQPQPVYTPAADLAAAEAEEETSYPAGEYVEDDGVDYNDYSEAPQGEEGLAPPEEEQEQHVEEQEHVEPAAAAAQPAYPSTWSNADAAKNLLNSLTKGSTAAVAAAPAPSAAAPQEQHHAPAQQHHATAQQPAQQQQQQQLHAPAQDQTLSSADNALPSATHYSAYGAAGTANPAKMPTAAEIEALQLSVNFGNFGLGDFGPAAYGPGGYGVSGVDASSGLLPKPAQAPEPSPTPASEQTYNGYGGYASSDKMGGQIAPSAAQQPVQQANTHAGAGPNTFSTFGPGAGAAFGAAFGSNFGSAVAPAAEPSAQASYAEAQQAFANYGQDNSLKAVGGVSGYQGAGAPGMGAYAMQQQLQQYQQPPQQQSQQPQQQQSQLQGSSAYHQQANATKSMYAPYSQAAPQQQQQQQQQASAVPDASGTGANLSAGGLGPAGMPAGPGGLPHQMHFANPQAGVQAAVQPGMAQYGAAGLYNQPYPQYNQPYPMANMGYNAYNMGYGYQNVNAYPPQPAATYGPNAAAAAYSVPHAQQHAGPRTQHTYSNPYSTPAQAGGPAQGGAPAGYGAAGQPSAYGLAGYEDMSTSGAAVAGSAYGGKDKDAGIYGQAQQGAYQGQHMRGNNYGNMYGNQSYGTQNYTQQQPRQGGGYAGGYNNRQQYGQQQQGQGQQQYGGPSGYNKGLAGQDLGSR